MNDLSRFDHPRSAEIDGYWAERLGVPGGWAAGRSVYVVPDENLRRDCFALFRRAGATVVRCRPSQLGSLGLRSDGCDDVAALRRRGRPWRTECLRYLDPPDLVPQDEGRTSTRRLTAEDGTAFETFLEACSEEDVRVADVRLVHPGLHGVFDEGHLVAAASLMHHGPVITDVGILVHPEHRRRGHGRRAVAAAAICDDVGGRIVQYCATETNTGSLRVSEALGFRPYAVETWFRTDEDSTGPRS